MPRFILPMLMWLTCLPAMADPARALQLLNYESPHHQPLPLSGDDWQWLRNKRELVLGTSQQNLPPLEMVNEAKEYEGITADYAGLLGDALGVKISVRAYDTREQVFSALAKGEIDFMGSVTQGEAERRQLLRSQIYLANRPTLVARLGDSPSLKNGLQGYRLAISLDSISLPVAQAMYPTARIESYASADAAMAAVAFGDADMLLGDAVLAQFLISRNYSDYLRIIYSGPASTSGFSFAVAPDNQRLQHLLDNACPRPGTPPAVRERRPATVCRPAPALGGSAASWCSSAGAGSGCSLRRPRCRARWHGPRSRGRTRPGRRAARRRARLHGHRKCSGCHCRGGSPRPAPPPAWRPG